MEVVMAYEIKEEMDPAETVVAIDFDAEALADVLYMFDRAEFELARAMLLQRDGHAHAGISLSEFRDRSAQLRQHRECFEGGRSILRGVQGEQRERIAEIEKARQERTTFDAIVDHVGDTV